MTKPPGRTYRYYTGKPVFEFGFGLSYTTFHQHCTFDVNFNKNNLEIKCTIENTGSLD
eukprot:Pgem_evm1s9736